MTLKCTEAEQKEFWKAAYLKAINSPHDPERMANEAVQVLIDNYGSTDEDNDGSICADELL